MKFSCKLLTILISISFPLVAFAQGMSDKPKPIYRSPEGELYVKSDQPIYLRLSLSPEDSAKSYLLKNDSGKSLENQEPFHFEGHGKHTIQHKADHRIPQKNRDLHVFYVHDDGRSPRIKVSVTKAPWVYNGNVNIYGKPVKITFDAKDSDSGVYATYFSLNKETFNIYKTPIALEEEADYTLKFYSVDNVGNESRQRMRLYSLDFTPPITKHTIHGGHINLAGEEILSPNAKITLRSKDYKAGVKQTRYRFKGKRGIYEKTPLTMEGLNDGVHSLIYAAEDRVKNEEANTTFTFYLDSVPPIVTDELIGDQYQKDDKTYVSGRTTVELKATDNKAGVKQIRYFLPKRKAKTYDYPFSFPKQNGTTPYSYLALDNVKNVSESVNKSVIMDISPPKVNPKFIGEHYFSRKTHYVRLSTKISLPTTDNLSGVKSVSYQLDATSDLADVTPHLEPFSLLTEGQHELGYTASDNVNNKSDLEKLTLFVDERSPEIYHHFSVNPTVPAEDVYPLKTLLYLAATDKEAGIREIYYSINGGKEIRYKRPLSFKTRRDYSIAIRVVDNVGNTSTSTVMFTIN